MSNFDGYAEGELIFDRLTANVAGGRVFDLMPDDVQIEKFADGKVKPFVVFRYGTPVRTRSDRTIAGERLQPHRMPITIGSYAGALRIARQQTAHIMDLMLDWRPNENSSAFITDGGDSFSERESANTPTRFADLIYGSIVINMEPNPADVDAPAGITP